MLGCRGGAFRNVDGAQSLRTTVLSVLLVLRTRVGVVRRSPREELIRALLHPCDRFGIIGADGDEHVATFDRRRRCRACYGARTVPGAVWLRRVGSSADRGAAAGSGRTRVAVL